MLKVGDKVKSCMFPEFGVATILRIEPPDPEDPTGDTYYSVRFEKFVYSDKDRWPTPEDCLKIQPVLPYYGGGPDTHTFRAKALSLYSVHESNLKRFDIKHVLLDRFNFEE